MEAKRGAAADIKRQRELGVFVYGVLQEQRPAPELHIGSIWL